MLDEIAIKTNLEIFQINEAIMDLVAQNLIEDIGGRYKILN